MARHRKHRSPTRRRSPRAPSFPGQPQIRPIYRRLLQHDNVVGCFIGRKIKGKKAQRSLALVCCVSKKRPERVLRPGALVPPRVEWIKTKRRRATVRTDVQPFGATGRYNAIGPGDGLQSPERATLGFSATHPRFGQVVTTAGHAFVPSGFHQITFNPPRPVRLHEVSAPPPGVVQGLALRAVVRPQADYALIAPDGPSHNLFQDAFPLRGVQVPTPAHVGRQAFGLTRSGPKRTRIVGVGGSMAVGGVPMIDLILTDNIAAPGDSGAALVDQQFLLLGVLVGFVTVAGRRLSAFAPAHVVLGLERAQLT